MEYFVKTFENTVRRCWNSPALDEYRTSSETYGQLASDIEKIHTYFEAAGLKRGDKIAINARSSANWIKTFMAAVSGGYVAVELFPVEQVKIYSGTWNQTETEIYHLSRTKVL